MVCVLQIKSYAVLFAPGPSAYRCRPAGHGASPGARLRAIRVAYTWGRFCGQGAGLYGLTCYLHQLPFNETEREWKCVSHRSHTWPTKARHAQIVRIYLLRNTAPASNAYIDNPQAEHTNPTGPISAR